MTAPVKSCYNTNIGAFLFGDEPVFSGEEHKAFLKCCESLSVMRVCVNTAATDSLVSELESFARKQCNYRVYGDEYVMYK